MRIFTIVTLLIDDDRNILTILDILFFSILYILIKRLRNLTSNIIFQYKKEPFFTKVINYLEIQKNLMPLNQMIEAFISIPAISRQSAPSISINPGNIIPYQLNLYIRSDGLKFTR